ncbi:hypothetical protein G3O00_32050 [Burkholderia sp. Ac-20384]|uniref:hypothetical protein n=1 Tax=Burkholderia sp. Ac-20384 TaxID=2703902 RepID=UPI0019813FDE|nr:hypothetical protein [Burkholderia sp. Ac-20384]MBN3828211.1 hypothetical protein [Burkholderia sp. Ac-20384]
MLNAEWRAARCSLARRGAAATGQGTAQPIVATKRGEFNRPESTIPARDENDQIIGNWRAAMHIKMNRS